MATQDCDKRRRMLLAGAGVCLLVALALLLAVTGADARPQSCVVVLDAATVEWATDELVGYQSALQSDEVLSGSMGQITGLENLISELDSAPRFGCQPEDLIPQFTW